MANPLKNEYVQIGGLVVVGIFIVAIAAKYGRSTSSTQSGTGVDTQALLGTEQYAVQLDQDATSLAIERVRDASNTLATLKGYEEQVALGNLSLQEAQAQYASATAIAQTNAQSQDVIAQANARSAAAIAGVNARAGVTEAQAAAGAQKSGDFWSNIGGVIGTVGSVVGKLFSHI